MCEAPFALPSLIQSITHHEWREKAVSIAPAEVLDYGLTAIFGEGCQPAVKVCSEGVEGLPVLPQGAATLLVELELLPSDGVFPTCNEYGDKLFVLPCRADIPELDHPIY